MSHMDRECKSALTRLLDALCEFERNSGRQSTLILVPQNPDEEIIIAQSGKPVASITPQVALRLAMQERANLEKPLGSM